MQASCTTSVASSTGPDALAERAAAAQEHALFIDTVNWLCAKRCEPLIDGIPVYSDEYHLGGPYARYLSGAVQEALRPVLSGGQ